MYYLLHQPEDLQTVTEEILPLFEKQSPKLLSFPADKDFSISEADVLILYLPDKTLREIIPATAEKDHSLAILPHPGNEYTSKGLGLTTEHERSGKRDYRNRKSSKTGSFIL